MIANTQLQALVCEDDTEILTIIKILLDDLDIQTIGATSVKSFKENLRKIRANIVILDYWIKNTRADELVKLLKTNDYYKDIPIILISATTGIEEIGERLGTTDTLAKPFDIDKFQSKIKQYI